MTRSCDRPLRPNPFDVYRDPNTGQWLVVKTQPQAQGPVAA